jgi:hypothetical protein
MQLRRGKYRTGTAARPVPLKKKNIFLAWGSTLKKKKTFPAASVAAETRHKKKNDRTIRSQGLTGLFCDLSCGCVVSLCVVLCCVVLSCFMVGLLHGCLASGLSCLRVVLPQGCFALWLSCLVVVLSCVCFVLWLFCLVVVLSCGCLVLWLSCLVVVLSWKLSCLPCWLRCLVVAFLIRCILCAS